MTVSIGVSTEEEIETVLCDDEIYDRISDDDCPAKEDFEIPFNAVDFFSAKVNDKLAGVIVMHGDKIHFNILKKHRKDAEYIFECFNQSWRKNMVAEVPSLYPDVLGFAKKVGFDEVEVVKNDYKKNGKLYDCHKLKYEEW